MSPDSRLDSSCNDQHLEEGEQLEKLTHADIRRELALVIERLLAAEDLPITFRAHQREAYESMLPWLRSGEPGHRRYFAHATGMGKTLHFLATTIEALKKLLRSLIVVPNQTLLVQTAKEIYLYTNGTVAVGHISSLPVEIRDHKDDSIVYATKGFQDKSIVIITQDSFRTWAKRLAEGFDPHIVIRDEMHWAYTDAQLAALDCFSEAVVLGYSATPDYLTTTARKHFVPVKLDNGTTLYADPNRLADTHFGSCLHRVGLREGIERGVLAPLAWGQIDLSTISLEDVPVIDGPMGYDYDPASLAKHMERNQSLVLEVIERLYETNEYGIRDLQVAAACPSVSFAEEFARIVGKYTRTASITGTTHHTDRQKILAAFEADEDEEADEVLRALSSVFVLREGWDSRNATMLLFLRATMSRVLYEQFLGRILRKRRDGKPKTAIVLDPLYQQAKFAPLSAPMLYGVPGEKVTRGGILIGQRGGKKLESPYIPKGARVTITVQPVEIQYWTDDKSLVEIEDKIGEGELAETRKETWGTRYSLTEVLGVSDKALEARISQCRSRPGMSSQGRPVTLYSLDDMRKACADLLNDLPKTGSNGLVEIEDKIGEGELAETRKETWGTRYSLTEVLGVSDKALEARISQCRSRPGMSSQGRPVTLYSLDDMRKACADLLNDLPKTGSNGLVEIEDKIGEGELAEMRKETWGVLTHIANHLGVSRMAVQDRRDQCRSRPGKDMVGRPVILYSLDDMRKACADLLGNPPKTDEDGLVEIEDRIGEGELAETKKEMWGTRPGLAKILNVSVDTIKSRTSRCRSRLGLSSRGVPTPLYSLDDMREACAIIRSNAKKSRQQKGRCS